MPLSLQDFASFMVPQAPQNMGADSVHRAAAGLRELSQMTQQRQIADMQVQQQRDALAARQRQAEAEAAAQLAAEQRRRADSHRATAVKTFGDMNQELMKPGGAARLDSQLPTLQANGIAWHATPDGKYSFTYAAGPNAPAENWGELDLGKMSAEDRAATEAALGAAQRASTARRPEDVAAAGAEAVAADPTLAGKEALAAYGAATNPQLQRIQSDENSRRSAAAMAAAGSRNDLGGSGGEGAVDPMNLNRALLRQQSIVRSVQAQGSTKELQKKIAETNQAINMMGDTKNPLSQNTAFFTRLKSFQGGRPTERDLAYQLREAGVLEGLLIGLKRWTDEGRFPEQYRSYFVQAAQLVKEYDSKRLRDVARAAGDAVAHDPGIPLFTNDRIAADLARQAEEIILSGEGATSVTAEPPPAPDDEWDYHDAAP